MVVDMGIPLSSPNSLTSRHARVTKSVIFVVCLSVVVLVSLVLAGVLLHSNWDTFIPDVIVGVVGAGAIAGLISFVTWTAQVRHERDAEISVAYDALIEAVGGLRGANLLSPRGQAAGDAIRRMNMRMVVLSELLDEQTPEIAVWFEAERQRCLHQALEAAKAVDALQKDDLLHDANDILDASRPLYEWTAEFINNVRFWRTGKLSTAQIKGEAEAIESRLREVGAWHEPMPWRKETTSDTGAA